MRGYSVRGERVLLAVLIAPDGELIPPDIIVDVPRITHLEDDNETETLTDILRYLHDNIDDYINRDTSGDVFREKLKILGTIDRREYYHFMKELRPYDPKDIHSKTCIDCEELTFYPPCEVNPKWCIKNLSDIQLSALKERIEYQPDIDPDVKDIFGERELIALKVTLTNGRTKIINRPNNIPVSAFYALFSHAKAPTPIYDMADRIPIWDDLDDDDFKNEYSPYFAGQDIDYLDLFAVPGDPDGSPCILPLQHINFYGGRRSITHENGYNIVAELPGQGGKYETCGEVKFAVRCQNSVNDNNCKEPARLRFNNCGRWDCPVCFKRPVNDRAERITERLQEMRKKYNKAGVRIGRCKHWVVSADPSIWTVEKVLKDKGRTFKAEINEILQEYALGGLYGGVVILHYFRKKHLDGSSCERKKCNIPHVWDWGPHVHYVGYGYYEQSNIVYWETGFTLMQITFKKVKSKWKNHRYRSTKATVRYLLTHCTRLFKEWPDVFTPQTLDDWADPTFTTRRTRINDGYSYNGYFSPSRGKRVIKEKGERNAVCSACGGDMLIFREGPGDTWFEDGILTERFERVGYVLNRKERKSWLRRWEYLIISDGD